MITAENFPQPPKLTFNPSADPGERRLALCQEITRLAFLAQHLGMSNAATTLHTALFNALKDAQRLSDTGEVK